jgi:hypothetical protein
MFAYPKKAEVNRVVAKSKILARCKASTRLKNLFVSEVGEILWKYKLSPETINLPERDGINEIQVFEIAVKASELDEAVLEAIDKAIPFPLLFRLVHREMIQFAAAFKRPSDADHSKWVIEATFRTDPHPLNAARPPLPVALDLAGLYEQILRCHMPLPARKNEGIRDHVARFKTIAVKEMKHALLEIQLRKERQFNRRVQTNAALRSLNRELKALKQI